MIAVLALYLFMRNKDRTNYKLPDIEEIPVAEISGIEISGPEGDISLKKTGDEWHIDPQGYPADKDKVQDMLEIIKRPVLATMVSESRNYARYGLEKDRKITVKAFKDGAIERVFEIGDTTEDKRRTFVMTGDDQRVFHSLTDIRSTFEKDMDGLRDKKVLSFDKEEITGIVIAKGDQVLRLTLDHASGEKDIKEDASSSGESEKVWQDAGGREVKQASMDELLYRLSGLSCEGYLYDTTKEGLENPICTVRLTGKKEYTLSIFAKRDNDKDPYPAVSSENDYAFMLKARYAEDLMDVWNKVFEIGQ